MGQTPVVGFEWRGSLLHIAEWPTTRGGATYRRTTERSIDGYGCPWDTCQRSRNRLYSM